MKWQPGETLILRRRYSAGESVRMIAKRMGRSTTCISKHLVDDGLRPPGTKTFGFHTRPDIAADNKRWCDARLAEVRAWRDRNRDWLS